MKEKINKIIIEEDHNTGVMIDKLAELMEQPDYPYSNGEPVECSCSEYSFAQLKLLIHALERLDTSEYDIGYKETHKYLLKRFRKMIKETN